MERRKGADERKKMREEKEQGWGEGMEGIEEMEEEKREGEGKREREREGEREGEGIEPGI